MSFFNLKLPIRLWWARSAGGKDPRHAQQRRDAREDVANEQNKETRAMRCRSGAVICSASVGLLRRLVSPRFDTR